MVFSEEDKAIIKNDFEEKGWTPYRIWKEHPNKEWDQRSVKTGTMARKEGSGRPVTVSTEENSEKVEEMICSQEEPGTHTSSREIAKQLDISHCSVRRMVKRRNISGFKRLKTPGMNEGTRGRRLERASNLVRKFEQNPRMVERAVFQDESPFTLEVPVNSQNNRVYFKGDKSDVPEENLCHQGNKQ
jgi:transposase